MLERENAGKVFVGESELARAMTEHVLANVGSSRCTAALARCVRCRCGKRVNPRREPGRSRALGTPRACCALTDAQVRPCVVDAVW